MKLSIITINYNNLKGLKRTADSILCQTWTDYEWIVVDGNSTDGSKEYIERLAEELQSEESNASSPWHVERFSLLGFTADGWDWNHENDKILDNDERRFLWCSEKDNGIYNAMNKGIVKAKGDFCLFMNSGDWLDNSMVLESFYKHDLSEDLICGKIQNREKKLICGMAYRQNFDSTDIMCCTIPHQSCFIKRSLFETIGLYDEALKIVSDWKFFVLAVAYWGCTYRFVDILISNQEPGGISDKNRYINERKKVSDELFPPKLKKDILLAHSTRLIRKNRFMRLIYSLLIRVATRLYE